LESTIKLDGCKPFNHSIKIGELIAKLKDADFSFETVFTNQNAKLIEATGNDKEMAPAIEINNIDISINFDKS
jgi:hypothetical protein